MASHTLTQQSQPDAALTAQTQLSLERAPYQVRKWIDIPNVKAYRGTLPATDAHTNELNPIAGVNFGDTKAVQIYRADQFQGADARDHSDQILGHEGVHMVQHQMPESMTSKFPPIDPRDPYADMRLTTAQLVQLRSQGDTLWKHSAEGQPSIIQNYIARHEWLDQKATSQQKQDYMNSAGDYEGAGNAEFESAYQPYLDDVDKLDLPNREPLPDATASSSALLPSYAMFTVSGDPADEGEMPARANANGAVAIPSSDAAVAQSIDAYTQQELQKQNSSLQANLAKASETDPNLAAEAQQLGFQTGVGLDVASRNMALVRKMALVQDARSANLPQTSPRLAKLLEDPNFSGVAYDDLGNLSRVEQGAATVRALTPMESFKYNFEDPANKALMQYPLTRMLSETVGASVKMAGDVGSFFGWHGTGPTKQNWLQRQAQADMPETYGLEHTGLDTLAENAGPMIPAMLASGGVSGIATALQLSENAAKILAAVGVGAMFSASQGGETYTRMSAAGKSDAAARRAAMEAAGITALPNMAMGMTDFVPALERNPLLSSLGIGGATGAAGQLAQNVATGEQPWYKGLGKGAVQGAAVMGGMHLGFGAFQSEMGGITDAVEASKLRTRSPQAFQASVNAMFEGDPSIRIPAQEFVDYFHGKNLDPAAAANQVGVSNLAEAAAAGSDLEIPKENFFGKLDPEHQKGLLPDVVDPRSGMTMRQAETARQELQEWNDNGGAAKLQAEYEQADAETQATPEWQSVHADLKQRYLDAGEKDTAADSYATLQANAIANLAKQSGMKPDELLALHNPKIVAGEAPETVLHQSVFHGSPYQFDQFSLDHLGTGEGAQAYGHGLYFAGDKRLAEYYRKTLSDNLPFVDGKPIDPTNPQHVAAGALAIHDGDKSAAMDDLRWTTEHADLFPEGGADVARKAMDAIRSGVKLPKAETRSGQLYETDIPEDHVMLDWDKPLSEQPGKVKAAISGLGAQILKPRQVGIPTREIEPDGAEIYRRLSLETKGPRTSADEVASKRLKSLGVEGIKYLDADSRAAGEGNHNYVVFDDKAVKILRTFYQASAAEPRGWFRMKPDGGYEIGKTKIGDMSTLIHEPAHAYLELFRELTAREKASAGLQDDFKKITAWLGTTPEEARANGFTREQHEQWARANEQYVREGKAPSAGLRRAFHNFAVWLGSIYQRATDLNVEVSPEIRGVMDRMYASEGAVDHAERQTGEPLFKTPEEAGWTEEQFRNYADAHGMAVDKAREQVSAEMNAAAEREKTADYREERGNVRDAVTEQLDARPEYTAIRSLRRGKLDDGTEMTLSRQAMVDQFGEERVKALNKLHPGLYRAAGGVDADTAAELFGFHSGEEMLRALEAAPRRTQAIEAATRDHLVNKYGDVRYDGTLNDRARFAIENDERAGNLYRELRALKTRLAKVEKKTADTKAAMAAITLPPLEEYQAAAHDMIVAKSSVDLQPYRYLNASRKFSRDAFEAAGKGDARRAFEAKNKELLNHFLFREAATESEWFDKFEKYAEKSVTSKGIQQRLGLAGGDTRDQYNWLLARYRIGSGAPKPERPLADWAQEQFDNMKEPAIAPGMFNESRAIDYRSAPLGELHDLRDALVNIRHLAMQDFKTYVAGKEVQFIDWRNRLIDAARENVTVKPERVLTRNATTLEKAIDALQGGTAALARMEFNADILDGRKAGAWHDLFDLYADSKGKWFELKREAAAKVQEAMENMPDEMRRLLWTEKVHIDGIPDSERTTRFDLLSMVLNMGNASNLDRLQKSFDVLGWDRSAIPQLPGLMTREELQFGQNLWDLLKPFGERMRVAEQERTGLPPVMVEPKPLKVTLADGSEMDLPGGYYPVKYDSRYTLKGYDDEAAKTAQNLMEKGWSRAVLSRGYTKERTGSAGPLHFDFEQVLSSHLDQVTKDLAFRDFLMAGNKLLRDTEVRKAVRETLGPAHEEQLIPWLKSVVNDSNGSLEQGLGRMSRAVRGLRRNWVEAKLAFSIPTALRQFTHVPRLMLFTQPGSFATALRDFVGSPRETTRMIHDASPNEMRFRGDNLDRDYRELLQAEGTKRKLSQAMINFGYAPIRYADHVISSSLWLAVYRDSLAKLADTPQEAAHSQAVHQADSAVRMGIGTGTPGDLPPIMRNNDYWKAATTLYGFENVNANIMRLEANRFQYTRNVPRLGYALAMGVMIPGLLGPLVTGERPKDGENWARWAMDKEALYLGGLLPLVRGVDPATEAVFKQIPKALKDAGKGMTAGDWTNAMIDALETGGEIGGMPGTAEATRILRYSHRASEGKVENPNVMDAVVGGGRK